MRKGVWGLAALAVLSLAAGWSRSDETATALPAQMHQHENMDYNLLVLRL